jgi:cadmium resistance protein CadD (predicted permease)
VSDPLSIIGRAAAAFAGTNVDDLIVLTVLFLAARAQGKPRLWQIVAGQYAGFAILVAVSASAAAGLVIVPVRWVGLLGLIPIALGLRGLWQSRSHHGKDTAPLPTGPFGICLITISNGGDNLSVYTPLFRTIGTGAAVLTIAVFFVLVVPWCAAAAVLSAHKKVVDTIQAVGHLLVPAVYITIGVWILIGSGTLTQAF